MAGGWRGIRLCRTVARPVFADDRLSWDVAARVGRDGTTHLEMTPIDFMERLIVQGIDPGSV